MTANGIDRLAHGLRGLVAGCVGLAVLGLACATAPAGQDTAATSAPMVLSEVRVAQRGVDAPSWACSGLQAPEYVDFRQEQPARIVVDLTASSPVRSPTRSPSTTAPSRRSRWPPAPIEGGGVRTRVELSLAKAADYEVVRQADRLEIRVTPREVAKAATPATAALRAAGRVGRRARAPQLAEVSRAGPGRRHAWCGSWPTARSRTRSTSRSADPERLVIDLPGLASSRRGRRSRSAASR